MGTRADFYLERDDKRLMWIGSKAHDGHPWHIPISILIQINPVMFEEMVTEFLMMHRKDSDIRQEGDKWPWPWADSRLTDYSYIFMNEQVCAWSPQAGALFDPVKILQGNDLKQSMIPYEIKFPIMNRAALKMQEETMELVYGPEFTEAV